ncbi:adhesion G-protein coupled receptor G2 isoform X2 [Gadus morhua]|uniref:adhesion G-protein coupled receptor G2 isoform X2 n=1 Tax=Gadus morhua TaxID=8049 RepID=UPI0011B76BC6|nr:adhesion G-protein coupled receptor G2-like isoform X2 [Gadus morhua]
MQRLAREEPRFLLLQESKLSKTISFLIYFKGSTMSLSLVLLLLPGILSTEVCVNISNGVVEMKLLDLVVTDERDDKIFNCMYKDEPCYINCTNMLNGEQLFYKNSNACSPVSSNWNITANFTIGPNVSCRVAACTRNQSELILKSVNQSRNGMDRMVEIHLLRLMCSDLFSEDQYLQILFLKVELQLIHLIMNMMKEQGKYVPGDMHQLDLKYMAFNIFPIGDKNLNRNETITGNENPNDNLIEVSQPDSDPSVWLPEDALGKIKEDRRVVNLVNYQSTQQFELHQEEFVSIVTRIEFLGMHSLSNLKTPIEMTFDIQSNISLMDKEVKCHYMEEEGFNWKKDGCKTSRNDTVVTCKCNHTTAFSVLLVPQPIPPEHWEILSYISYIGCGLSAFFSALSLMIYVVTRKPREEPSIFIHVSLSGALFLLNSSFLLTEWGARWNPGWVCELIAALVHYSLLGSFSWMAVEGLHLYLMLIKVFNTEYKHYQLKLSLFGWGIPAVVVGVTWSLKDVKQMYGLSTLTMLDSNQTTSILVFIFNSGILLIVAVRVCCMVTTPARKGLGCRTATTVAGITCLLGVTWGLAFLGSGYVNLPILYLFCILNSTQGAFIFFWILGLARIERKRALEAKNASVSTNDSKVTSVK